MSAATRRRSVKDFQFGSKIGEGSYSTVYKAADVHSRKVFAIKILSKSHIVKEKKIKYVNIEKQTLNRLGHHPGVVTLYYTFQDESSLFFVIDFAEYGELLTLIRKLGSLNEITTRYYMIQLVDAIKFMHSKGVIHRDLKPENILLNHDMKLMITDFGAAKILDAEGNVEEPKNNLPISGESGEEKDRLASFVGTAEYVSPELLQHNECGYESDIWAIGCILYQFIVGMPPFKGNTEYLTFEKIIALDYKFPNYYIPDPIKHLIKNILVLDPKKRYKIGDIQGHQFFKNVPWNEFSYIWKRNPPKIEAYDPRLYLQKPVVALENSTKIIQHKQPAYYKKPVATSSKTLDIINNTYVPSSNNIMPGGSPKKVLQALHTPASKGYPKMAPFTRNLPGPGATSNNNNANTSAASVGVTGMGIRNKVSEQSYQHLQPQQQQQQQQQQQIVNVSKSTGLTSSPSSQRFQTNAQTTIQAPSQNHAYQQNPVTAQNYSQSQNSSPTRHPQHQSSVSTQQSRTGHEKQNSNTSVLSQPRQLQKQHTDQPLSQFQSLPHSQPVNYHFPKPIQPNQLSSQSQPSSPVSFNRRNVSMENIQKPVLMDQSQIMQKQMQMRKPTDPFSANPVKAQDRLHTAETAKPGAADVVSSSSNVNDVFGPLDTVSSDLVDNVQQRRAEGRELGSKKPQTFVDKSVKDPVTAASEAIQSAQKFRAKNLFASSNINISSEHLTNSEQSPKSFTSSQHSNGKLNNFKSPNYSQHPYAMMRSGGALSLTANERSISSPFINPELRTGSSIPIDPPLSSHNHYSPTASSFSHFEMPNMNHQNFSHLRSRSSASNTPELSSQQSYSYSGQSNNANTSPVKSFAPPLATATKSLTLDTNSLGAASEEILSPKNPFATYNSTESRNSSISSQAVKEHQYSSLPKARENRSASEALISVQPKFLSSSVCPSPVIYLDEDISPDDNQISEIPEELTRLLVQDEQIIKLDTIVVSELTFDDILVTNPDLLSDTANGKKLNLTDATINEIIGKHAKIIDYYSKPEIMFVTTTGRLFILQSIALSNKLFEITLTDSRISLYDYEFDESGHSGYLLLELVDKQSLLFLSPHDHKRVNIDFEINNTITWIECLFKAKQLLKPRKKSNEAMKPGRSVSAPLLNIQKENGVESLDGGNVDKNSSTTGNDQTRHTNSSGAVPITPTSSKSRRVSSSSSVKNRIRSPTLNQNGSSFKIPELKSNVKIASGSKSASDAPGANVAAAAAAAAAISKDYRHSANHKANMLWPEKIALQNLSVLSQNLLRVSMTKKKQSTL